MVRQWYINRSCCRKGESGILLNGLSLQQEEGHACGQCRVTVQFFIDVELDLLLGDYLSQGRGPTLQHPIPGLPSPGL